MSAASSSSFSVSSSSSTSSSSSSSSPPAPTLENILATRSLRWIFVGGKGGVGKTTTSCSLAAALSRCRSSVLLISTDPAHNLSDAFNQKFSKHPTLVSGYQNLFAMEIDPTVEIETGDVLESSTTSLISDLASSIPGIDEAMSFAELMKQVQTMSYETIVFDTAPTGHTLRLLSFPTVLTKAFDKLQQLRSKFSGVFSQMQSMLSSSLNAPANSEEKLMARMDDIKKSVEMINEQFRDPSITTFVCVCIPEFLSLYETERLIQELAKYEIDSKNVVVNQILFPEDECKKCRARYRMQKKYLDQIFTLYDDFHVVTMPLLDEEVRGTEAIQIFSKMLINGHGLKFKEAIPSEKAE